MNSHFFYHASPLGNLEIGITDGKISSIIFTDKNEQPETGSDDLELACRQQLDEYFSGKRREFNLPVKQNGTEFQLKVWDLLCRIPFGKTISYQTLANQYGELKAIRAVASANGKNNLAILVPCHRVIGSNQSLTGYAGGLWRKKWLLEHESKQYHGTRQLELIP